MVGLARRPYEYRPKSQTYKKTGSILHSLICRVLLLLLLLLRSASDLRNCTSYFGACMWVWYCRPPIGAHFHPTPQSPPVPQQLGEKAHLRIAWSVAALRRPPNCGRTRLVIISFQPSGSILPRVQIIIIIKPISIAPWCPVIHLSTNIQMRRPVTVQNGLRSTSSLSETFQRLEERVVREQTELSRDVASIRENQARLERRINELPQQQRTAALPGQTNILCVCLSV